MRERIEYPVYGTFKVTTEGDSEGKSVRNLGTYTGYIDEIAFALADKCAYSLSFALVHPEELNLVPKRNKVNVTLEIDSGTWDMDDYERTEYFKKIFKDRNVEIERGTSYKSCTLITKKETIAEKRKKILDKLTKEEKEILGITE